MFIEAFINNLKLNKNYKLLVLYLRVLKYKTYILISRECYI